LENLDYIVIGSYFGLVFLIAGVLIWRDRRESKAEASTEYFLGGRNLGWFIIGASLFASNIGSEHLVGLAGAGASGDFPAGQFEILAAVMLLFLGWIFVPFYISSGVFTMPEFLEKRYDSWARSYLSWVSIIAYILTKISVTIAAGGIIFTALLGIPFWTGAIIIVVATGLYTVLGGLKAVVYTDMIQMFILLGGSIAITFYGLNYLGGWGELNTRIEPSYLNLWRGFSNPDFPWTGILLGAPILGVWYWCTDQFIVQRVLAAKSIDQARKGTIFAGFLKLLPLFIFVLPGVIAFALSKGPDPVLTFPMENGKPVYDAALPLITMQLLPNGLRGLVVAGLVAALMSSLSSVFNSCSTLFTMDIYSQYYPNTSQKKLVRVGQLATVVLVVLGLAWIPLLKIIEGGLFQKLQSIQAYISPPIAAVFLLGVFHKRIHAKGAKVALITGAALGVIRLTLELVKNNLNGIWLYIAEINFLHFALILFLICTFLLVAVSYMTPAREDKSTGLTYRFNIHSFIQLNGNKVLSIVLLLLILGLWWVFS
jgi:SSS family solute:Na+ symporter